MPRLFDTLKGSCGKEVVVGARRIATQRVALHADDMGPTTSRRRCRPAPALPLLGAFHNVRGATASRYRVHPRQAVVYLMHAIAIRPARRAAEGLIHSIRPVGRCRHGYQTVLTGRNSCRLEQG